MLDEHCIECFEVDVLGEMVDVLYCFWKAPKQEIYLPKSVHMHRYCEVHYAIGGPRQYVIEQEIVEIQEGEAILIAPDVLHNSCSDDSRGRSFTYQVREPEGCLSCLSMRQPFRVLQGMNTWYMQQVIEEFSAQQPGYREKMRALFQLALLELVQKLGGAAPYAPANLSRGHYGMLIERYITSGIAGTQRMPEHVSLKEGLAKELNISQRHLERIVHSVFGMSYSELCKKHKFRLAMRLLTQMGWKSREVAALLGYSDEANFSRAFTNYYGVSPSKLSFCDIDSE